MAEKLSSNVTAIYSNANAFAALKSDGSVVTWGDSSNGGNSNAVARKLGSNVTAIYSNANAFAALKSDGSVVTWGSYFSGGNASAITYTGNNSYSESSVAERLSSNVTAIYSNQWAFVALKSDASVVYWGKMNTGDHVTISTSGSQRQIFVRLVGDVIPWAGEGDLVCAGDLVFSSLKSANDSVETKTLPLFGTIRASSGSFTGSADNSGGGGGAPASSGGGGAAEVKKSKKGGGKSSSAKKSGGSKKSDSKKSAGSNSSSGKKSGGKKAKKK